MLGEPLVESDRQALSAAVFLALSDDGGRADWPWRDIEAAPPCPVSSFEVGGVRWDVTGGEGSAPLRWARAPGVEVFYFLAQGPSLKEARDWAATRRNGAATGRSATYLVGTDGSMQYVLRMYDGAPDARRLADDLTAAISDRLSPIAAFDPTGNAVTVALEAEGGLTGELFRPALIGPGRHASLLGPDGHFFVPIANGVRLRGSDLVCGDGYGPFWRTRLSVLAPNDQTLDLGCSLHSEESWISIFSTRRPDASGDKAMFQEQIRSTQADTGTKRRPVTSRGGRNDTLRASSVWIDKDDIGQGLWFIRWGEFIVEVRATFRLEETDAVYDVLEAVLTNTPPSTAPAADDRG